MIKYLVTLVVLCATSHANPATKASPSSCQACHPVDPNKVNVHLVPHSHDDVGWLKTVDQYFWGLHSDIQEAGVQYIISSVVEALKTSADRRYVQVETAFFWKWWQHQPEAIKEDVIRLVNAGQLEFINAAWSMNDEATTNYQSIIDQFTYGLRVVDETVGACGAPTIGWQIDPFGHSREQASIFAQLGFDAVFFARISDNDRNERSSSKNLEFIWKGSASSDNNDIFTSAFPEFYYPPWNYCFDIECGDQTINDDRSSADYNVPNKVADFGPYMQRLAAYYQTNNVLIPMGGDFQYQSAEKNFANMDKLLTAFKDNPTVNVIYSTPSCYVQAVNDEATTKEVEFTQKTDDFFPYGSESHTYWTGFFTSRPNAKRFERFSNNILQAAKQLASFSKVEGKDLAGNLTDLQEAIGILQHHDAITGTAKRAVAKDYVRLLHKGIRRVEPAISGVITDLLKKTSDGPSLRLESCLLANVSICEITESASFLVAVYNPLERPVSHYVRVPVPRGTYKVQSEEVAVELVDSISTFSYIPLTVGTVQPKELVFEAQDVPPLGIKLFYVERTGAAAADVPSPPQTKFGTDTTGFEIDSTTGFLKSVTMNGETLEISQEFLYYEGHPGANSYSADRASGAYVFRPRLNASSPVSSEITYTSTSNSLVDEVHQKFNDWVSQIIRVYKGAEDSYIEFDWLVGPIPINVVAGIGQEIVSRFTVENFDNAQTFYTDSNGRELIKRQLNKRYDFSYDVNDEPIASNYYPVTSKILIRDETKKLEVAVLNDRSQGGSSLQNGEIELMVHRRLLDDDGMGVGEALNDTEYTDQGVVARGRHFLVLGPVATTAAPERKLALKKLLEPVVLFADASSADLTLQKVQAALNFKFEGLKGTLPDNVHILTLEPWQRDSYLLRLEHILERDEDAALSTSVTVSLKGLFTLFDITEITETTLGANHVLQEFEAKKRYVWNVKGQGQVGNNPAASPVTVDKLEVTLDPTQIRTFIIKVAKPEV